MDLIEILITWLIVASSLVFVSKIPFVGIEIDSYPKAIGVAVVFGILNALLVPILRLFFAVPNFFTLGLLSSGFSFVINVVVFGVAAYLVKGFALRNGIWSAVLGALSLSLVTSLISSFVYGLA